MPFIIKRRILNALAFLLVIALLFFRDFLLETPLGVFLLVVYVIAYAILTLVWWRCPHCNSYLWKLSPFAAYCPHCGEKLED